MPDIHYRGDIQPNGEVTPFRAVARDNVHPDAVRLLEGSDAIEVIDNITNAQGMLIRSATKFQQDAHFEQCQDLMYIARVGVGMDNINMPLASSYGIATVNTPGASTKAVAQRSLALMLAWSSRAVQGTDALVHDRWPKGDESVEPIDLTEKTLGIIGFGRIGQELKKFAEPHFGRVLFSDVRDIPGKHELEELLIESDVVSIHMSGTNEILTKDNLSLLKPGSLIVNTARGEVINMAALAERMDEGIHAALDVFPTEGPKMFEEESLRTVLHHPNFIGTPHTAASDPVTQRNLGKEGAQRIVEFAHQGIINPYDVPGHTLPKITPKLAKDPHIRALLTHQSVPGVLASITGVVARSKTNILELINEEGSFNGDHKLAVTAIDLAEQREDVALRIMHAIEKKLPILKKRLLKYS